MKIEQLPHGQIEDLRVVPLGPDDLFPAEIRNGAEVRLRYVDRESLAFLEHEDARVAIRGLGRADSVALTDLCTRNLPRLAWVEDGRPKVARLQVHTFLSERPVPELQLGVDEKVLEGLARKHGLRSVGEAIAWLGDQLLLPAGSVGARAFATAESDGKGFVLHGRGIRAVVQRVGRAGGESLLVNRVIGSAARDTGEAITLLVGDIRFGDATAAVALAVEAAAELSALVSAGSSFLDIWRRYGELENETALRRARQAGSLAYDHVDPTMDGRFRFVLAPDVELAEVDRFKDALRDDGQGLEAADVLPDVLRREISWAEYAARPKPKGATVPTFRNRIEVARRERTVTLQPSRTDEASAPPPKGFLFPSLRGDGTRLERREEAQKAIREARCPMPQLGLLLEGRPVPVPRRGEIKALSPAIKRKVFGERSPTPTQVEALEVALNTPDIALIQGPPGTGKTTIVVALVERLQELWDTAEGVQGRVLLSGFQHDAVRNAIQRMSVNGLPAIKFGEQGESGGVDAPDAVVERWCLERAAELRKKRPARGVSEQARHLRNTREAYRLAPGTLDQTATLLGRLGTDLSAALPVALSERIRALAAELSERARVAKEPDPQRERLLRRVRALRASATSFADDGPRNARLLRVELERAGQLSPDVAARLDAAARWDANAPPPFLGGLAGLQRSLLAGLLPAPGDDAVPRVRTDVLDLFAEVEEALEQRRKTRRDAAEDAVADFLDALEGDPFAIKAAIITYTSVFAATCQQSARKELGELKGSQSYDTVVVDEAARANPLDLFVPIAKASRRIVLVGDHRQLPHLLDDELQRELEQALGVSVSPAERATKLLEESLFERLFADLRTREASDKVRRTVTLDEQYRMHPALGALVSKHFYAPYGEAFRSPRPAGEFVHGLPGHPGPASWLAVPRGGEEKLGTSWRRLPEAEAIADEVRRLMESERGGALTFGVITYYRAQVAALQDALVTKGVAYREEDGSVRYHPTFGELKLPDGRIVERLRVGTVDAFQGMEFDVVFLSLVRSNSHRCGGPETFPRKYGRLLSPNLLCVSMSRQKRLLVVAGDPEMVTGPGTQAIAALADFHALADAGAGDV